LGYVVVFKLMDEHGIAIMSTRPLTTSNHSNQTTLWLWCAFYKIIKWFLWI